MTILNQITTLTKTNETDNTNQNNDPNQNNQQDPTNTDSIDHNNPTNQTFLRSKHVAVPGRASKIDLFGIL